MSKPKIAFLGPVASYTHQASLENFPSSTYELESKHSIEAVFHAVQDGSAFRGVVPFENSTNGTVIHTLDLFADRKKELPDVLVCGEAYVDVHHCLAGRSGGGHPQGQQAGVMDEDLANIKLPPLTKIYSHPQVWGQCEEFLQKHLPGIERQDVSSTSKAAELVAQETSLDAASHTASSDPAVAAISSVTAARIYGLDILASGIQDVKGNMTRFFILQRAAGSPPVSPSIGRPGSASPPPAGGPGPDVPMVMGPLATSAVGNPFTSPQFKTLISFVIPHTSPGALAKGLGVFEPYGLNLTSINTRPSLIEPWNYLFFVEILGSREQGGRGPMNAALRDLQGVARHWRWHGSWEMQSELGM